ncbi:unnamed protein product, partial [Rotaria sp. Silwood1]
DTEVGEVSSLLITTATTTTATTATTTTTTATTTTATTTTATTATTTTATTTTATTATTTTATTATTTTATTTTATTATTTTATTTRTASFISGSPRVRIGYQVTQNINTPCNLNTEEDLTRFIDDLRMRLSPLLIVATPSKCPNLPYASCPNETQPQHQNNCSYCGKNNLCANVPESQCKPKDLPGIDYYCKYVLYFIN